MKLRCPACGAEVALEAMTQAADLLALAKAQAAFAGDWPLVAEYLACFQAKRALKVAKQLRLAREVWQMWDTGKFCVGGIWYRIGREEFREALKTTCNQVAPGLTNHNYLKKVLVAAAEKTGRRLEAEQREKESRLQSGRRDDPLPRGENLPDDPAWRAQGIELGKAVRRARTPEAKEAATQAYRAHMEGTTDGTETGREQH